MFNVKRVKLNAKIGFNVYNVNAGSGHGKVARRVRRRNFRRNV